MLLRLTIFIFSVALILGVIGMWGSQAPSEARASCILAARAKRYFVVMPNTNLNSNLKRYFEVQAEAVFDNYCEIRSWYPHPFRMHDLGNIPELTVASYPMPKPSSAFDAYNAAEMVRTVTSLSPSASPEFQTATFKCVRDHEICNTLYIQQASTADAGLICGFTFLVCMGQQLKPSAGK
jgi:hypothetical protein